MDTTYNSQHQIRQAIRSNLQTISLLTSGFTNDTKGVQDLALAFQNLSKSQQSATLAAIGKNNVDKQEILTTSARIASGELVTKQTIERTIATQGLTAAQKNELSSEIQRFAVQKGVSVLNKEQVAELVSELAARGLVTKGKEADTVATIMNTKAQAANNLTQWQSIKALAVMATKYLVFAAAVGLIVAVYKAVDSYTHRVERAAEATDKAFEAFESTKSEMESTADEIQKVSDRLDELYKLQGTNKWNVDLQNELTSLETQNATLRTQIELLKEKKKLEQREALDTLNSEVDTTRSAKDYSSLYNYTMAPGVYVGQGMGYVEGGPVYDRISEAQYYDESIRKLAELRVQKQAGIALDKEQISLYDGISSNLNEIGIRYSEWAQRYRDAGNEYEAQLWANRAEDIVNATKESDYYAQSQETNSKIVKAAIEDQSGALYKYRDELKSISRTDFLKDTASEAYKAVQTFAEENKMSLESAIVYLQNMGMLFGDVSDSVNQTTLSFEALVSASEDLEDAAKSFDTLTKAVEEYNTQGYISVDTLNALNAISPSIVASLYDESGGFNATAIAALGSSDAVWDAIIANAQMRVAAAQANFDALVTQYGNVEAAAAAAASAQWDSAAAALASAQKDLSALTELRKAGYGGSRKGGGGGGGKKSLTSKAYDEMKELTEYSIEMSKLRQGAMEDESDAFLAETQQQLIYYTDLANATKAEIDRLRSAGYDASNSMMRDLEKQYQTYLNSIYDASKSIWEAEKQAQIDAIQSQIDAENDRWDAREKQLDHEIDAQQALIDLEEEYRDLLRDVREEIASLDKELSSAKSQFGYLDEEARKSLFNDADYKDLTSRLNAIMSEAGEMYEDYIEKIGQVGVETSYELEYITDEFERQYELKLKEYEIAKADLAVAKARRELESVLNERNVAMLVNGVWTWVADPEAVREAVEAVYDAEAEATQALTDYNDTLKIQELQAYLSSIELMKDAEQAAHDKIIDGLQEQMKAIQQMEFNLDEMNRILAEGIEGLMAAFAGVSAARSYSSGGGGGGGDGIGGCSGDGQSDMRQAYEKSETKAGDWKSAEIDQYNAGRGAEKTWASEGMDKDIGDWGMFSEGGAVDYTGPAMLHGGAGYGSEMVLKNEDVRKVYDLIHTTPDLTSNITKNLFSTLQGIARNIIGGAGATAATTIYIGDVQLSQAQTNELLPVLRRVLPLTGH